MHAAEAPTALGTGQPMGFHAVCRTDSDAMPAAPPCPLPSLRSGIARRPTLGEPWRLMVRTGAAVLQQFLVWHRTQPLITHDLPAVNAGGVKGREHQLLLLLVPDGGGLTPAVTPAQAEG
jgi:hypothetical protein